MVAVEASQGMGFAVSDGFVNGSAYLVNADESPPPLSQSSINLG